MRKVHIKYPVLSRAQHEKLSLTTKENYKEVYQAVTGQEWLSYKSCWQFEDKFYYLETSGETTAIRRSYSMESVPGNSVQMGLYIRVSYPEFTAEEHHALFLASEREQFGIAFKNLAGYDYKRHSTPWFFCGKFYNERSPGEFETTTVWHDPVNMMVDPWPLPKTRARLSLAERFNKVSDHAIEVCEDNGISTTFNFMMQQVIVDTAKPGVPGTVMNFEDVQRQEAIIEAYERLKDMGGTPPDPTVIRMPGKKPVLGRGGF